MFGCAFLFICIINLPLSDGDFFDDAINWVGDKVVKPVVGVLEDAAKLAVDVANDVAVVLKNAARGLAIVSPGLGIWVSPPDCTFILGMAAAGGGDPTTTSTTTTTTTTTTVTTTTPKEDEDDWAISDECKCPPNEEPGQNSCNGCEPKCDDDDDSLLDCTLMFCSCSCDCKNGLVRNSRTNQCIPQEQCPED
uniref:TIL domain-containing protein n=1 Tax=Globodera rostochiensis TaxID=31243 RepID=A0A914IE73_GLORO